MLCLCGGAAALGQDQVVAGVDLGTPGALYWDRVVNIGLLSEGHHPRTVTGDPMFQMQNAGIM
jgi:hypothetical protein